jgi:hypothetical protein
MSDDISKLDEELFVLLAIEDSARRWAREAKRWDEVAKKLVAGNIANDSRNRATPMLVAHCLASLRLELAWQRLGYDTLRRHMQEKADAQFMEVIELHEKFLNSLEENLTALEKPFAQFLYVVREILNGANSRALATGIGAALYAWGNGESDETMFARGVIGTAIAAGQERKQAIQATSPLREDLAKEFNRFVDSMNDIISEASIVWSDTIRKSKWNDPELAFNVMDSNARRCNPFELVARMVPAVRQKGVSTNELIEFAEKCRRASQRVPSDKAFNFYRAHFLSVAGIIANRAAAKDLGVTGLPTQPEDAPKGGALAREIWDDYVEFQPFDAQFTDETVRNQFLAHAYAGDPQGAYKIAEKYIMVRPPPANPRRKKAPNLVKGELRLSSSPQSQFWYDCARVCSVSGHTKVAVLCLTHAVNRLKFPDTTTAKLSPDFRQVREDHTTRNAFERIFSPDASRRFSGDF